MCTTFVPLFLSKDVKHCHSMYKRKTPISGGSLLDISTTNTSVPEAGLEPARLIQPTDFKSVMSTNSITRAVLLRRRPDSNRRMAVLQTDPLDHLGTTPNQKT